MQRQNVIAKWAKSLHTPCALLICFPSGLGRARVFVSEFEVVVYEVANGLHAAPSKRTAANNLQAISDRWSVSQYRLPSKNTRVSSGKLLDRVLNRIGPNRIRFADSR